MWQSLGKLVNKLWFSILYGFLVSGLATWLPGLFRDQGFLLSEEAESGLFFLISITALAVWLLIRSQTRAAQRQEDREQIAATDAGGEKRFVRALGEKDRIYLRQQMGWPLAKQLMTLVGMVFVLLLLCLDNGRTDLPWNLDLLIAFFYIAYIISRIVDIRQDHYYDLRTDAVQQIEGEVIKECDHTRSGKIQRLIVRGLIFGQNELPKIRKIYDQIRDDEQLRVEFTPYGHNILLIERVPSGQVLFRI